jgi:photosystem II stability/assembly factor-like uncharacterized protein
MTETGSERVDVLIEEVVRRRAGSGRAPVDLLSAVAAEIGETPQDRSGFNGFGGRGTSRLLLIAAAVAVSGTVAIGLVGGAHPTPETRLASPNPLTATVLPTSAPAEPPGIALDFTTIGGFTATLTSDAVGWATTTKALFRSTDDGRTWHDTHAPGLAEQPEIKIVSDSAAFVGWRTADGDLNVAATQDGGATWNTATIGSSPNGVGPLLDLRTATSGTATVIDEADALPTTLRTWSTTDGGRTWDGPARAKLLDKLAGWDGGAMWLNFGKADNVPFDEHLWISFDGGLTWPQRTFPTGANVPRGTLKWLANPPFVDGAGRLVILVSNADGEGVFASRDDGHTWGLVRWFPDHQGALHVQWLTSDEWVLTNDAGTDVWSTADGGATWRHVVGDERIYALAQSFVSTDHAWAEHACRRRDFLRMGPDPLCDGNTKTGFLLETTDGGKSWQQVGG